MGQINEVLSFEDTTAEDGSPLSDVVLDPGGGANIKAAHFSSAGDDSKPLPGDFAATVDGGEGTGTQQVTGYHDPRNAPKAGPGEKRLYARAAGGVPVIEMWLKSTGVFVVTGLLPAGGKIELDSLTGTVDINGVKIDTSGNVTTPGEITAKDASPATSVSLSGHLHPTALGPSGPPTGGT